MTILYAPYAAMLQQLQPQVQQQPRQGMFQPEFYLQQQQQKPEPTTADFITGTLQRLKQRPTLPNLTPGSRATGVDRSIADPSNFQSYYKQLATIKTIGQEQVIRAQAEAAASRLAVAQALTKISSGGGSGGTTYKGPSTSNVGSVPSNPRANFSFAQNIAGNYGWNNPSELAAWYTLGMKESGWNNNAQNPTSTAYGIGQFLNSTWGGYGIPKTSDPALQVEAMARYIRARYGSPSKALAFHYSHNWY